MKITPVISIESLSIMDKDEATVTGKHVQQNQQFYNTTMVSEFQKVKIQKPTTKQHPSRQ